VVDRDLEQTLERRERRPQLIGALAGTDTSMMPAKAPDSSASWLFSQFPPWSPTTSATAATSPERSSPTTVSTNVVMRSL
jgi:hypothetical protein